MQEFWRKKTNARVNDKRKAEILAPQTPPHPYGTKRVSLEQNYYEAFNRPEVDIISLKEDPIDTFTETGIRTVSGDEREFDLIVMATGYDAISGGVTQIDIRGEAGRTVKEKWAEGTRTHLGICVKEFPNMYVYPLGVEDVCEVNADARLVLGLSSTDLKPRQRLPLAPTPRRCKASGLDRACHTFARMATTRFSQRQKQRRSGGSMWMRLAEPDCSRRQRAGTSVPTFQVRLPLRILLRSTVID